MTTLTQYDTTKMTKDEIVSAWKSWQIRTFVTIWFTYGSFYLCRANMSFALPGLSAEFGFSKTLLGLLGTSLFIAYSLGQFINGQLGDKYGARKLVFIGMIGSALLNIVFSFSTCPGYGSSRRKRNKLSSADRSVPTPSWSQREL